ncbi:alpha/beta hydrolase family protein [Lacinutrix venerupis]|uniref:Hydrolase n=1 Tax=Lacinutrix venerupis TaxID=1486034 RepID=A0AAC9LL57_9FLAO|nr:alpha/beta fold hydrolase [Lacinutrix venerupis]APX99582.1 hydrolase [Lacinutrix venerupis]
MQQKVIEIEQENKHSIFVTQFIPETSNQKSIVISSATGVVQTYYSKFALHFCSLGFTVYTFDYSGIGLSYSKHIKNNTSNLLDWAKNQAAVLEFAKNTNPKYKLTLITHSIGGQLTAFNKNIALADAIITVASQSGYWNLFPGLQKLKMLFFWNVLIPTTTPFFGYFPAKKLGLFESVPKHAVYQWKRWGNRKDYFLSEPNKDNFYIDLVTCPMLVLSFPKDNFAPKQTVDWLASIFSNAKIDRRHLVSNAGHFGFFRTRFANTLWIMTEQWIENNT